jgi:uncharacterized protein (DUF2345 family)
MVQGSVQSQSSDSYCTVHGDTVTRITGAATTVIGTHETPQPYQVSVQGDVSIVASDQVTIEAIHGIVIRCGQSVFKLGPERVDIISPTVAVRANGAKMVLTEETVKVQASGEAKIAGDNVHVVSSGAEVKLTDEAKIGGSAIKLTSAESESSEDESSQSTELEVKDKQGHPMAGRPYDLMTDDGIVGVGVLDADGKAKVDLEADARVFVQGVGPLEKK